MLLKYRHKAACFLLPVSALTQAPPLGSSAQEWEPHEELHQTPSALMLPGVGRKGLQHSLVHQSRSVLHVFALIRALPLKLWIMAVLKENTTPTPTHL